MFIFLNDQHKKEYKYLLSCHTKYMNLIPQNEWSSTSYLISALDVTDLFLSVLNSDLTVDQVKFKNHMLSIPIKKRNLVHYAIQQSNHQIEQICFNDVIKKLSHKDITLILNAVDTNYFQLALG